MKVYKKYDTLKNRQYNLLAMEYLKLNNIKVAHFGWHGMVGNSDILKQIKDIII